MNDARTLGRCDCALGLPSTHWSKSVELVLFLPDLCYEFDQTLILLVKK
jgi:hypothetical protein